MIGQDGYDTQAFCVYSESTPVIKRATLEPSTFLCFLTPASFPLILLSSTPLHLQLAPLPNPSTPEGPDHLRCLSHCLSQHAHLSHKVWYLDTQTPQEADRVV